MLFSRKSNNNLFSFFKFLKGKNLKETIKKIISLLIIIFKKMFWYSIILSLIGYLLPNFEKNFENVKNIFKLSNLILDGFGRLVFIILKFFGY